MLSNDNPGVSNKPRVLAPGTIFGQIAARPHGIQKTGCRQPLAVFAGLNTFCALQAAAFGHRITPALFLSCSGNGCDLAVDHNASMRKYFAALANAPCLGVLTKSVHDNFIDMNKSKNLSGLFIK